MERLEALCGRSEQCTSEVAEKLRRWGIAPQKAREIVESLTHRRYVDDSRYAAAFVRDKAAYLRWGRVKIRAALMQKRVAAPLVAQALEAEIDPEAYAATLLGLLRSKARTLREGNTFENRSRLTRFAASRGFEPALIARTLQNPAVWPREEPEQEEEEP